MTTFPTINLNGTDGKQLLNDYREALDLANQLITKLANIRPHGRDYQTMPTGSFEKARDEHEFQIRRVNDLIHHLTTVAVNIIEQER